MANAEELGRRYFKAIEDGDVEAALATLADNVRFWTPAGSFEGKDRARGFIQGYIEGFPGATFAITSVIGSESSAAIEGSWAGSNSGPMRTPDGQEMPPTGRDVDVPFVTMFDADGEHLTSHRAYWDQMGFMAQLGLTPDAGG